MGVPGRPWRMVEATCSLRQVVELPGFQGRAESPLEAHAMTGAAVLVEQVEQFRLSWWRRFSCCRNGETCGSNQKRQ